MFIDQKHFELTNKSPQTRIKTNNYFINHNYSNYNSSDIYHNKQQSSHLAQHQTQIQNIKSIYLAINNNLISNPKNQSTKNKLEDQYEERQQIDIVQVNHQPDNIEISQESNYISLPNQQQQQDNIKLHHHELLSISQPIQIQINNIMKNQYPLFLQLSQSLPLTKNNIQYLNHLQNEINHNDHSKMIQEKFNPQFTPRPKSKINNAFSYIKTYPLKGSTHQQPKLNNQQKTIPKFSKSLITHKFHNFNKPSFKSHLKTESSCFDNIEKRFYYQINKQPLTLNRNKPIKSLNFPLLNSQDLKKMTFQQLFSYEKKKMQNVNTKLTQTKSDSLFKFQDNSKKIKNRDLKNYLNTHYSTNNIWNRKICHQNDKLPYTSHSKMNYLLSSTQKKRSCKNQVNDCDHEKIVDSDSQSQKEHFHEINRNGSSQESKEQNYSLKKHLKTQNKKRKKLSVSLVTTYNFDYIRKENIQKSQIKQLGRKYLQQKNKKSTKQNQPSSKISIINIRGQQLSNLRKQDHLPIYQTHVENTQNSLKQPFNSIHKNPNVQAKQIKQHLIHNSSKVQTKQIKQELNKNNQNAQFKQIKQNSNKNNHKIVEVKQSLNKNNYKMQTCHIKQKCSRFRNQNALENGKEKSNNIEMWTSRQKFQPWQNEQFREENFPNDFQQITY